MTHHRRQLTTDMNTSFTQLSLPYRCRKSLLSYGIWHSSLNMIEIIHQHRSASKCFLSMGVMKNSKFYLYPEEAIFMMQCSLLQVSMNEKQSIPISLDEAYSIWLNKSFPTLQHLHVYQYLTRIGFILIRHRLEMMMTDKTENLVQIATNTSKRKREDEEESMEVSEKEVEDVNYICPIHSSADCQRQWFPDYTAASPVDIRLYPRLRCPEKFSSIHIDWVPSEFNLKVSRVQLSIYENKIFSPRPSYSLLRSIDLQSHSTIYQRLSSFISPANQSSSSNITFDMYTPRKHFRKSQPDLPDYYIQIKDGNEEFHFEDIYNAQQTKMLTAIVHNGDVCFYTLKSFDPIAALQ